MKNARVVKIVFDVDGKRRRYAAWQVEKDATEAAVSAGLDEAWRVIREDLFCASHGMKIEEARPPNYADVVRAVGKPPDGAVFTWGDTLYVSPPPPGYTHNIDAFLMAHEQHHTAQQATAGGPKVWWKNWCENPDFRLQQELEAYRVQYALACTELQRPRRRALLRKIAKDLSSAMYGSVLSYEEAYIAIAGVKPAREVA